MIKKLIKRFIPACFLFLGVFTSCTSENEPDSPASMSGISLRLQTSAGSTRSSVDTGTDLENQIHNIHLWFFASGASNTDKALFYKSEFPTSAGSELVLNYTDEVLRLHNMNSEGKYQLFVVANLPADAIIDDETTLEELKKYSYSASARPSSPFYMAGSTNGVHDFSIDSQVSISLLRVASRLDVKIINATGKTLEVNKVSIAHDQQSVQLFAPASGTVAPASNPFTAVADIYTTSITADKVECSGYVYENRSTTSTDVVIEGSVDGNAVTWTVPITPDGSTILPRNSICKTTINLKGITPVDVTYSIEEWKNTLIDNSLDETYVELSSNSIKLNEVGEGAIYVNSNADSIKIDLNGAPQIAVESYFNESVFYMKPKEKNLYYINLLMSELNEEEYNGTISITANNLVYQIPVIKYASFTKLHYTLPYPNGTALPWYINTSYKIVLKLDRNIAAYVTLQRMDKLVINDEVQKYPKKYYELPYPPTSAEDSFEIPVELNLDPNAQVIYEIQVGVLSSAYGVPVAKYTYIIEPYDSSLQPF